MNVRNKSSKILKILSLTLLIALVVGSWSTVNSYGPADLETGGGLAIIPTFDIVSVVADQSVTIRTYNFPANDSFQVLMGQMGTRGVGGTLVETIDSGSGGSFTRTFNIPAGLKGLRQIAIRLQSTRSAYYSYNWFYNNPSGTIPDTGTGGNPGSPTRTPGPSLPVGTIPTFNITAVDRDRTVSIQTANFPANDTFTVRMGRIGTRGVNGYNVGTFNSGTGGAQTGVFNIPVDLQGQAQIAIRLESPTSGYYSYNWFTNTSTGGTVPDTGDGTGGLPTVTPAPIRTVFPTPSFTITGVTGDATVSIRTANFPANDTFNVYMGQMGTRGVNGTLVGTFSSGAGGAQNGTFNIPDGLKGQRQIAIRLESPTSRYFAYNWFYNSTFP